MYWKQVAAATAAALAAAWGAISLGQPLAVGVAVALFIYVGVRVFAATRGRIQYWLGRGTRGVHTRNCGKCGNYIYRKGGDWILTCHRCGWTAGWPGVRWLTQSVPAIQFRRSLSKERLALLLVAVILISTTSFGASVSGVGSGIDEGGISGAGTPDSSLTTTDQSTTPQTTQSVQPTPTPVQTNTPETTSTHSRTRTSTGTPTPTPEWTFNVTPKPDQDGDSLPDNLEQRVGTDPNKKDTDGDRLDDYEEYNNRTWQGYPLPGSDPTHKDVYLYLFVPNNVPDVSSSERASLRELWAGMPVSNPDGETGIDLHINQSRVGYEQSNGTSAGFDELRERYYSDQFVSDDAQCTVHVCLLPDITNDEVAGRGSTPGYFLIADGSETQKWDTEYTVRVTTITHELLHNIVGEFDDGSTHTLDGWLYHGGGEYGDHFGMADKTRRHLSNQGFDSSAYYELEVC